MRTIRQNDLLIASRKLESRTLLILEESPSSVAHHSKLIDLAIRNKTNVPSGTLLVCLDVTDGKYGTNVKVIDPVTGLQGWMVYGSLEFVDES